MGRVARLGGVALTGAVVGLVAWAWGDARWPGHAVIRGHVGDVGAAAMVYAAVALLTRWRPSWSAVAAAAVALAVELRQRGGAVGGAAGDLVLGAHFDAWDLVAYAVGIGAAAWWDHRGRSSAARGRSVGLP